MKTGSRVGRGYSFLSLWMVPVAIAAWPGASRALEVEITPEISAEQEQSLLWAERVALSDPALRRELSGARFHVISRDFASAASARGPSRWFELVVYDYDKDRKLLVRGEDDRRPEQVSVQVLSPRETDSEFDPLPESPTEEEVQDAMDLLKAHPYFSEKLASHEWEIYRAMPGILKVPGDRSRIVSLGIASASDASACGATVETNEIVGVNLSRQRVIRYTLGYAPETLATRIVCGPPGAGQRTTARGTRGSSQIAIRSGQEVLWTLNVTRPSASAGRWGSGIELSDVTYKGRKILKHAGVPIFNVKYDRNRCGPYRDWAYQEGAFEAQGTEIAPGILQASSEPKTILESGTDRGNYRGVAIYAQGDEVTLVSELEAGWYRYVSRWTFRADGTILPRFGFDAVRDSCTCNVHTHHAYWRFEFDGEGDGRDLEISDGATWSPVGVETRFRRGAGARAWKVRNAETGGGVSLVPGPQDGVADDYGKGDVWALVSHPGQYDDSRVYRGTSANIDAFVNGESLEGEDLVLWYGAHFNHDASSGHESPHVLGPTIRVLDLSNP